MSQTEDDILQRVCEEVEAEMGVQLHGAVFHVYAKAVARRYAAMVGGVPEGYRLVPEEPTPEMIKAGVRSMQDTDELHDPYIRVAPIYLWMLHAAPSDLPDGGSEDGAEG